MTDDTRPDGPSVNYGLQVGGNASFNANSVAVGPNARAWSTGPGPPLAEDPALLAEARRRVDAILAEIANVADQSGRTDHGVLAALHEGAAELAKEEPRRSVVVEALKRAAAAVTSAGAVAGAIEAVLHLLGVRG
jgi:hypothetical protein